MCQTNTTPKDSQSTDDYVSAQGSTDTGYQTPPERHEPTIFELSNVRHLEYPLNLVPDLTTTHTLTLEAYRKRLNDVKRQLFLTYEDDIEVPIRDVYFDSSKGNVIEDRTIQSPAQLDDWLGVDRTSNNGNGARYPKCRFIYPYASHSRDRLRLTHSMLARILTHHQVMPDFLDFIFVFGVHSTPQDLFFSRFCEQTLLDYVPSIPTIPERSWSQYQLCYNLKGVSLAYRSVEDYRMNEWSNRQAAIYHQFDVVHGTTLWIVAKGILDLHWRFKELTSETSPPDSNSFSNVQECFRSSLAAHLMYCHWSMEDWRGYIGWLEGVIEKESAIQIYGPRSPSSAGRTYYSPNDIRDLQHWQDKTNEATAMLDSNIDVLTALKSYYVSLATNEKFPLRQECQKSIFVFAADVDKIFSWQRAQIPRTKLLEGNIAYRKVFVMQAIQDQAAAIQDQAAERTQELNQNLEKEAISMRIITIVTLLYLPATFVSTFFGTDVVKYQSSEGGEPGNGRYSNVAMMRWLQVTIPLTIVTMYTAWVAYTMSTKRRERREVGMRSETSEEIAISDIQEV